MDDILCFVIRWSRNISPGLFSVIQNFVNVSFFTLLRVCPLGLVTIFSVNQVIRVRHGIGFQHRCVRRFSFTELGKFFNRQIVS